MAIVTSVRWCLIEGLVVIDLIIIDEYFPCAFIILRIVSTVYLLKLASRNLTLFGILLRRLTPGHLLRAGVM